MKNLILIRGIPGSGKTRIASALFTDGLIDEYQEADDYFYDEWGKYVFDAGKLDEAHLLCYNATERWMKLEYNVAVSNCFLLESQIQPYRDLAAKYGYNVQEIWVMPSKFESEHAVPEESMQRMRIRFFNTMREVASNYIKYFSKPKWAQETENGN